MPFDNVEGMKLNIQFAHKYERKSYATITRQMQLALNNEVARFSIYYSEVEKLL